MFSAKAGPKVWALALAWCKKALLWGMGPTLQLCINLCLWHNIFFGYLSIKESLFCHIVQFCLFVLTGL